MSKKLIMSMLLCSCSFSALAQVYKWANAEGRVHFGDRPPQPGVEIIPLAPVQEPPGVTAAERLKTQKKLLDAFEAERTQRQDAQERARQEKAEREHNCHAARQLLESGIRSSAMFYESEAGERVYLGESERELSIEQRRQDVEIWCGKAER